MPRHIPALQVREQYPAFVREVSRDLRLDAKEQAIINGVNPVVWAYWGVSVFSGDEQKSYPSKEKLELLHGDDALPLFAGEFVHDGERLLDFQAGTLAQKADALHTSRNPSHTQRFERFSATMAKFALSAAQAIWSWESFVPQVSQTSLQTNPKTKGLHVTFPGGTDATYNVEGPAKTVVNIGPGLTGSDFAEMLIGHAETLHFISGGKGAHFVNTYVGCELEKVASGVEGYRRQGSLPRNMHFPPNVTAKNLRFPEVVMHTDGIAPVLGRLATRTTADIVVMSSVHAAGATENLAGVEGAKQILRPGGLLVVKAPTESLGTEAGLDIVGPHAAELFGGPVAAGDCGKLQYEIARSEQISRPASFAIYKQAG